ncbi:MAG: CHAT domain-containing protein [Balneolaceae bacterium]|nr:CHAT domain-containing protein [Balneolaceae bacterium]MBO6546761.1 CHAT domain-containing protein [Balneolaceae bacterium]MBO6649121.1 CHAT domain-containing protein [Balneolaceae bacterium]
MSILLSLSLFQTSFESETVDQAIFYLDQINEEKDLSEYYWALNELYQSSCHTNNSVIRIIINSDAKKVKNYFSQIRCGESEIERDSKKLERAKLIALEEKLFGLGVFYLLHENKLEAQKAFIDAFKIKTNNKLTELQLAFLDKIVDQNRSYLQINEIPVEEHDFIFYSIIYSRQVRSYFDLNTLNIIADNWSDGDNSTDIEIISSLKVANLVNLAFDLNRYNTVRRLLPSVLNDKLFPHSVIKTRFLNAITYALFTIGRYDESLKVLRNQLIPLATYLELKSLTDDATLTKGVNLYSLGKFAEAKDVFESIYYDNSSTIDKSQLFNNLSICYLRLGEKNKYLTYQLTALEEAEEADSYKNRLIILRNLFLYYTSIKDAETALSYLNRAEMIARNNNDTYELAAIHSFSGTFFWEIYNDAERALQELSIAQQEFNPTTDFIDFVNALKAEAEILVSIGNLAEATSKFEELRQLSIQYSNTPNYLESLIGLMEIALLNNQADKAASILEEIKIYPQDDLDFELSVKYHTVSSQLMHQQGNTRKAYTNFIPIIQQITDRARTSIDSQTGYWSIESEFINAFNAVLSMLIELGDYNKAIQLLDELKTINDVALYNSPILRAQRLSEEDLAQDQLLNDQIINLRTELLSAETTDEKFDLKNQIDQLSAQREEILNKIRSNISLNAVSIWSVQRKLPQGKMIIHYTEIGDQLYASYITKDLLDIEVIPFDTPTKQLFENAANQLASAKTDLNLLFNIYEVLNLDTKIHSDITSVTVIPDNYLYRLPLGILPIEQPRSSISYGSTEYLIEKLDIHYFTSINELVNNSRGVSSDALYDFSAYALSDFSNFAAQNLPSLPFATEEVKSITSSLRNFDKKNIFLETEATKASFLQGAANSKIVHVATHSEVSEQDPLFSTIYLNNNTSQELTSLYAYELFDAEMNNELIMLNSCSSGSGGYLQGSGIMGISRALRYAGANSLALNLWSVNDKTASEFAISFYESVDNGTPKWEAMRNAKLTLLKSGNANPYYWGAYILIGNTSPLTEKPAKAGFLYPFLLLIIVVSGYKIRESV